MYDIEITDNIENMIIIGKKLLELPPKEYQENFLPYVTQKIGKYVPNLSEEDRKVVLYRYLYDYWVYGINIKEYFYYGFSYFSGKKKETFLGESGLNVYWNALNSKEDAFFVDNKWEASQRFPESFKRDVSLVREGEFEKFCEFADKHTVFFAKPLDLCQGLGVFKIDIRKYKNMEKLFHKIFNAMEELKSIFPEDRDFATSILLEEAIIEVPEMAQFHPASVNGIRITTLYTDNGVKLFYPFMRSGVNNAYASNFNHGGICAGIDVDTGVINTIGFDENALVYQRHPQTGVAYYGFQIPKWDEAISFVTDLANKVPTVRMIGWDLVLTEKGWCLLEGNALPGVDILQVAAQKGLKNELEELVNWKPQGGFWWEQ